MITNRYFKYLCGLVGKQKEYGHLLDILEKTVFTFKVPNDDNRAADGEQLRYDFLDRVGPTGSSLLPDGPCCVLEMLIGVANRLVFELDNGPYKKDVSGWFWVLIDNLGLTSCTDDKYLYYDSMMETQDQVVKTLDVLLNRTYKRTGEGGLFPLKNTRKDQRKVEIWYQMSEWVIENYPI